MTDAEQPDDIGSPQLPDWGADPALSAAVLEIEAHHAGAGWDQPAQLYALVDTADLARREPALAASLGLDQADQDGSLTAVEQDRLAGEFEQALEAITWPDSVTGCAAVIERFVLPPNVDGQVPTGWASAQEFAATHPDRQEVRIVAGVTRNGATYCALRLRSHDDDQSVIAGPDVVPALLDLLTATFHEEDNDV